MQSILVAVDGSSHSLKGVERGAELARLLKARLELVNVLPPILLPPGGYADTIVKLEEGNRSAAEEILKRAKDVAKQAGVEADTVMLNGAPAEAIADLAQSERVWGVVVGAKGHSAVTRVLLGSVADRLVHICSKPVLVVR
jgi:nucleotide-binding universal stress UspA family protein